MKRLMIEDLNSDYMLSRDLTKMHVVAYISDNGKSMCTLQLLTTGNATPQWGFVPVGANGAPVEYTAPGARESMEKAAEDETLLVFESFSDMAEWFLESVLQDSSSDDDEQADEKSEPRVNPHIPKYMEENAHYWYVVFCDLRTGDLKGAGIMSLQEDITDMQKVRRTAAEVFQVSPPIIDTVRNIDKLIREKLLGHLISNRYYSAEQLLELNSSKWATVQRQLWSVSLWDYPPVGSVGLVILDSQYELLSDWEVMERVLNLNSVIAEGIERPVVKYDVRRISFEHKRHNFPGLVTNVFYSADDLKKMGGRELELLIEP